MLYDRWRSIESVVASGGLSGSIVLDGIGPDLVPDDMIGFHRLSAGEEWNHFVYAEILERVGGVDLERISHVVARVPDPPSSSPSVSWRREPCAVSDELQCCWIGSRGVTNWRSPGIRLRGWK